MLHKLMKNKKLVIVMLVAVVFIIGSIAIVATRSGTKENGNAKDDVIMEDENGYESEKDDVASESEDSGNGLQVKDEVDGTVDSIDGSGSWDETDDTNNQNEQETDKNHNTDNETDSNHRENDEDGVSNEDVLVDDKEWSDIN